MLSHRSLRRIVPVIAILLTTMSLTVAPSAAGAATLFDSRFPTEEAFVDQMYRDVLSRGPDPDGLRYWAERLRDTTTPDELVEFLITSPEFEANTAPIVRLYHSILDRSPDLEGLRFWVAQTNAGSPLATTAGAMLEGAEFAALADAANTDEVVAAVYGRSLGRSPDAAGLTYWRGEIDSGRLTLAQFVAAISESPEHRALLGSDVSTTLLYLAMLQRVPEPAGLDYWSDLFDSGTRLRTLVGVFFDQPEWRNRFPAGVGFTSVVIAGFDHPWDVETLPDGTGLVTERAGRLVAIAPISGQTRSVAADFSDLFAGGETGLMGLAVDPNFTSNRRIYTCQGYRDPANTALRDIRVLAWTLDLGSTAATRVGPVVTGMPLATGRHGGCQLEFASDGSLFIGTGDGAVGTTPQDLGSLGGKVLRVDPLTGEGKAGNPFASSTNADTRRIFTYGHRNVQGLSQRPGTIEMWSVEHGPTRDDEINRLRPGGNGAWNPVPGYNESVPMTDTSLANAMTAAWSTGSPTLALSGAEWLDDPSWGSLDGGLAVTALRGRSLSIHLFNAEGLSLGRTSALLSGNRLRGLHQADDGSLWVTSDLGGGLDTVTILTPN